MSREEFDKLLQHEYDGIREYDNPLPGWWKSVFAASIVFAIVYCIYYHGGGPGMSEADEYKAELKEYAALQAKIAEKTGKVDEKTLADLSKNSAALESAKKVFNKNCVACHGFKAEGKIGPNLTDDHQIHGNTRVDIYNTIKNGVPAKGMIAWSKVLKHAELLNVAAYIATLPVE